MKIKKRENPHFDPITREISKLLNRIPKVGSYISRIYLWRYTMINTMIVGASGTILTFLLYEGIFRRLLISFWGGAFLGMIVTTLLVFFWNYFWNRHWSLSINAQLYSMNKGELNELQYNIKKVMASNFDAKALRLLRGFDDDLHYSAQS